MLAASGTEMRDKSIVARNKRDVKDSHVAEKRQN
jgi:hypothetical protein